MEVNPQWVAIGVMAIFQVYGLYRASQNRTGDALGKDIEALRKGLEETRKDLQTVRENHIELKTRVEYSLVASTRRRAREAHKPDDEYNLDALLEKYESGQCSEAEIILLISCLERAIAEHASGEDVGNLEALLDGLLALYAPADRLQEQLKSFGHAVENIERARREGTDHLIGVIRKLPH